MTTTLPDRATILAQVAALSRLDRTEMQERWRALFDTEPPGYGTELMRRRIAYRIQELAYGGISTATRQRLRDIDAAAQRSKKPTDPSVPIIGTVLIKEWGGERHDVTVIQDGFQYRGQRHSSLSSIARLITGTNWNGFRFFGLRGQKKPKAKES